MKNKVFQRGFAAILAVLLCLSLFPVALAAGEPAIVLSSVEAKPGDAVEVTVSLQNNPGVQSMWVNFEYDDSVLELSAIELNKEKLDAYVAAYNADTTNEGHNTEKYPGEYQPISYEEAVLKDEAGKIIGIDWLLLAYPDTAYAEDGVIATLKFTVKAEAAAGDLEVKATLDAENNFNEAGNITYTVTNGKVTVKGEETPGEHIPGDINGDGKVNNKDITRLMRYVRYKDVEVNEAALDVNGDGKVNNKDITRLMRYVRYKDVEIH